MLPYLAREPPQGGPGAPVGALAGDWGPCPTTSNMLRCHGGERSIRGVGSSPQAPRPAGPEAAEVCSMSKRIQFSLACDPSRKAQAQGGFQQPCLCCLHF
ncbi:transient receptor potential cation channel subfamily M member 8 [Platysternon megacephalum]|uniref:Transient receptor potential cation channel subfamily M member 8 n=1 Tax=Platysternon megacephalum TaxID=55544 RepID=A0A4D9E501_9SAUR|nr:transient receptor potential cation channel subfamily M member 8 [Platysternon megacephalum]